MDLMDALTQERFAAAEKQLADLHDEFGEVWDDLADTMKLVKRLVIVVARQQEMIEELTAALEERA